jgi:protein-tyrosine phosphatase
MFDLSACHLERTAGGDYLLHWKAPADVSRVAVYLSDSPEPFYREAGLGQPLLYATASPVHIANPDPAVRHYFCLESERGELAILAERQLPLEGSPNFRDLGGYETFDGRRLKWGRLYRSGTLSRLTDTDLHRLRRLGLTLVCDFRNELEQALEPSRLHADRGVKRASLPVTPGSLQGFIDSLHRGVIQVDDASRLMQAINREFVSGQLPRYAEMFRLLLLEEQAVLIHCASGKDRTGFGAALILDVLGVDEDQIIEDYLLTNRYLPVEEEAERLSQAVRDQAGQKLPGHVLRPLLELRPEYLAACFEEIRGRFASKEHFFETALDLDAEKLALLRKRYLQ